MSDTDNSTPETPRAAGRSFRLRLPKLQFRMRTLLVAITLFAIAFGWWMSAGRRQQAAVAAIRRAGAHVCYDFHDAGLKGPAHVPAWLVKKLGVDWFADVTRVQGWGSWNDTGMEHLKGLKALTRLDLLGTQITDAGLEYLKNLKALTSLGLPCTRISDAGLEHLKSLKALNILVLNGTQVTDAGIQRLKAALPNCRVYR